MRPPFGRLDGDDVDVPVEVQRATATGSRQATRNRGATLVGEDRQTGPRVGASFLLVRLDALDGEPKSLQLLLDDALGAFLGAEHALLADEPGGQIVELLDAGVDELANGVEHGGSS
jgi:hypothetical protein